MRNRRRAALAVATLGGALAVAAPAGASFVVACGGGSPPVKVGDWNFLSGGSSESTGCWNPLSFTNHSATFDSDGLSVAGNPPGNGNSATKWAEARGYTGPTIVSKTLVSWVKLDNLNVVSGAPLGLYSPNAVSPTSNGDVFDSVVYGESGNHQWEPGSDFFHRSAGDSPYPGSDLGSSTVLRKVAIAYSYPGTGTAETITGCLNGQPLGSYVTGNAPARFGTSAEALFGPRHKASDVTPVGSLDAHIHEDQIWNGALTCGQVAALQPTTSRPATCQLVRVTRHDPAAAGHDTADVRVTDPDGAVSIVARGADGSATVHNGSVAVPSFTPGETAPIDAIATKASQSAAAGATQFSLDITDLDGRVTHCV